MPQEITTIHFRGVNCYLVKTGDGGYALIDTGFSTKRTDIEKELENAGCKPGNLKLIALPLGILTMPTTAHIFENSIARA